MRLLALVIDVGSVFCDDWENGPLIAAPEGIDVCGIAPAQLEAVEHPEFDPTDMAGLRMLAARAGGAEDEVAAALRRPDGDRRKGGPGSMESAAAAREPESTPPREKRCTVPTSTLVRSVVVFRAMALLVSGCSSPSAESRSTTPAVTPEAAAAAHGGATCVVEGAEVVSGTEPLPTTAPPCA